MVMLPSRHGERGNLCIHNEVLITGKPTEMEKLYVQDRFMIQFYAYHLHLGPKILEATLVTISVHNGIRTVRTGGVFPTN